MYLIQHAYSNTEICFPDKRMNTELFIHEVGHSTPVPGYTSNKNLRDMYVLSFVTSGTGIANNKNIIEAPCCMVSTPQNIHFYSVSEKDTPRFEQYWIIIGGKDATNFLTTCGFPTEPCVFPCPYANQAAQILKELQNVFHYVEKDDHLLMLSALYELMSLHVAYSNPKSHYTSRVQSLINYIRNHYAEPLTEDSLACSLHLSTHYMHKIFKKETGVSPIRYLNAYRVQCAKKLLTRDDLSISQIATALGFSTHNYFCSVFRKYTNNESPSEYRKRHKF